MVTKTKKDFSVAFLLRDNNNNDYTSKWNSIPIINDTVITPSEYWLSSKFYFFFNFYNKINF
jgi:hypothetical protein